jgi:hypothetical protein
MTFVSADGLRYTTWLPLAMKNDFAKSNTFPITPNGDYQAQSISIMRGHGLVIGGIDR